MNEAETRAEHIDPALASAGWGVVDGSKVRREYGIAPGRIEGRGRRGRALSADYVLEYRNTRLAVVEAKAWDAPLTEGLAQAKQYAEKLSVRYACCTNGQAIYRVDMQTGVEGEIPCYPTPDELWQFTFPESGTPAAQWHGRFADVPFEDRGGSFEGRYYQQTAIERVMDAIAAGRKRILLTLATGTGKTFIAFQIAWKLFHSRWSLSSAGSETSSIARRPRILFLADRNILANQAYNAFSAFPEDALVRIAPDAIRKSGRVPKNGSVFFTIFQTFLCGPNDTPNFGEYPPDFFDFIIIDECHRGGANDESSWRSILDHFAPAVQLGLTATPKRQINVDTYAYFGEPVFVYSLKDGINDGFLTPFRVRQIQTTLDSYVYTSDDTVLSGQVDRTREYSASDFNRTIEIEARERKLVELFMSQIDQQEKTLVFCATQAHALLIRDLINKVKTSSDPNYCHRVTADDGELGEQHLRAFQDNEKSIPTILTTSQKLSTGVDARNVRNIVLLRPCNNMIEFKQIIGRGTRLYDGKDYFTIYDFVQAHLNFLDPEWDGDPANAGLPPTNGGPGAQGGNGQATPPTTGGGAQQRPPMVKIKLSDGKARQIQSMSMTTFWHPDGTPMSSQEFLQLLFGELPELFKDESELRTIWSVPDTRSRLLESLATKGFGRDQLAEIQRLIDAEKSDLFDVLAHIAWASPTLTRAVPAANAQAQLDSEFTDKQRAFVDFVLAHYVSEGVDELDSSKLSPLLRLRYNNSIADAVADLGNPELIGRVFAGFQKYLYQRGA